MFRCIRTWVAIHLVALQALFSTLVVKEIQLKQGAPYKSLELEHENGQKSAQIWHTHYHGGDFIKQSK
jgi:hypothetical protein